MSALDTIDLTISYTGFRVIGSGRRIFDLLEMGMLIGATGYLLHILI